jgi:hypothetical protein
MLGPDYWNAVTSLLFGMGFQALVTTRCSPATSCYSPNSNNITSKLYLVTRRGRAQRMGVLPTLRKSSPSSKFLQTQDSTIWWTNTCPWHGGNTILQLHSSKCSVLASFSFKVLFIAGAEPWAARGVMTLSPRDLGTCRHAHD